MEPNPTIGEIETTVAKIVPNPQPASGVGVISGKTNGAARSESAAVQNVERPVAVTSDGSDGPDHTRCESPDIADGTTDIGRERDGAKSPLPPDAGAVAVTNTTGEPLTGHDTHTGSVMFDYGQLSFDVAETVRQSADRIHGRNKNIAQELFAIGRELINVKDTLPHGAFGPWLEAEFCWNERTAQRFMRAAEVLGDKSDTVSILGATAIYGLSAPSTSRAVREEIVARLESGEHLTSQAVLERVRKKRRGSVPSSSPAAPEPQVFEQKSDNTPMGQVDPTDLSVADRQADMLAPGRCAADLLLERFNGDLDELARCLAAADAGELLRHLLQGCAARACWQRESND